MTDTDLLAAVAAQEKTLVFERFTLETAWTLGTALRDLALARSAPVAIDISLRDRPLFHAALLSAGPDNADWIRRKRNTVLTLGTSTLAVGLKLKASGETLESRYGLPLRDHAAHGGGFPLLMAGLGCIGAITISGLPQVEDHGLVVEGLERHLGL
ncbi:MAG: heme-degrading domain-containing protein [Gemmatimonadaceae bacterium]|nr:heme-degrading domain-containing protein [Caulobacter sp.]